MSAVSLHHLKVPSFHKINVIEMDILMNLTGSMPGWSGGPCQAYVVNRCMMLAS